MIALEHAKKTDPNNKIHVIVASHNEKTVEFALKTYLSIAEVKFFKKHISIFYVIQNGINEYQT